MSSPIASYPLVESVSITLDGSGNGKARWTPGQPSGNARAAGGASPGRNSGYSVNLTGVAVKVSTNTLEAQCSTFVSFGVQSTSDTDFQGQTSVGSTGDTCTIDTGALRPGDWVTSAWSGGDAGAIATMTMRGTANPPGGI